MTEETCCFNGELFSVFINKQFLFLDTVAYEVTKDLVRAASSCSNKMHNRQTAIWWLAPVHLESTYLMSASHSLLFLHLWALRQTPSNSNKDISGLRNLPETYNHTNFHWTPHLTSHANCLLLHILPPAVVYSEFSEYGKKWLPWLQKRFTACCVCTRQTFVLVCTSFWECVGCAGGQSLSALYEFPLGLSLSPGWELCVSHLKKGQSL